MKVYKNKIKSKGEINIIVIVGGSIKLMTYWENGMNNIRTGI